MINTSLVLRVKDEFLFNASDSSSIRLLSSVYHALKKQVFYLLVVDQQYRHLLTLEKNGWVRLSEDANGEADTQRGDIFIWGIRGNSGGYDRTFWECLWTQIIAVTLISGRDCNEQSD